MGLFDQPEEKPWWFEFRRRPGDPEFGDYSLAYWRAARLLVKNWPLDYYIHAAAAFPIGFLYRHALELAVKMLLFNCAMDTKAKDILRSGHQLSPPIADLRTLRQADAPEFDAAETSGASFEDLEKLLMEWDKYDRGAEMFRYPVKKDLNSALPYNDFLLDVPEFAKKMDAAIEYVFAVNGAILRKRRWEFEQLLEQLGGGRPLDE